MFSFTKFEISCTFHTVHLLLYIQCTSISNIMFLKMYPIFRASNIMVIINYLHITFSDDKQNVTNYHRTFIEGFGNCQQNRTAIDGFRSVLWTVSETINNVTFIDSFLILSIKTIYIDRCKTINNGSLLLNHKSSFALIVSICQ